MRLLITGKTRSGKSTTLHQLLSDLLRRPWIKVLLLDGKGVELAPYANQPNVTYAGPDQLSLWAVHLDNIAFGLAARFAQLAKAGKRVADPDAPRYLIIADEVQIGCRDQQHGRTIKNALTHISEQSAALGDVLILTCQREQNSLPPAVRWNCNAKLRMLGAGYFHYQPDGQPHVAGRVPYIEPAETLARLTQPLNGTACPEPAEGAELPINTATLLQLLNADHSDQEQDARANATLYFGDVGTGRTYQLHHHPTNGSKNSIYVDLQEPHKAWLSSILEQCGATLPSKVSTAELSEMAALAIRAQPTTLLMDNLDAAQPRTRNAINLLLDAAANVALAAQPPDTAVRERKINPFVSRCRIVRIPPLSKIEAQDLADQHLPTDIPRRQATLRRIVDMGNNHPATIVNLCKQAKTGSLSELRHLESTPRMFNFGIILLLPILILILVWRYQVDSYLASALLLAAMMLLRPFIYRSVRNTTR